MDRFKHHLANLLSSFWFVPSLIVMASIALAVGLIEVDAAKGHEWMENWPRIFGAGSEGARGILATIAGSMVTVVGVTFSMTLMTLTLASSQYTSRILRNFMRDRVTQVVLGIFAGIFAYCVVVLRTIRGGDDGGFIPSLAVTMSLVLAITGIGALIYFIHHIASSIQASCIIAAVARETLIAVDRLFPERLGEGPSREEDGGPDPPPPGKRWETITAAKNGYLQHVDNAALMEFAREHGTVVRMQRAIGEFVVRDTPLAAVALEGPPDKRMIRALRGAFVIDRFRTLEQDAAFGVRQIVDIALRALSPSTNDTTTAVMCVDHLGSILARLASRDIPSSRRYEEGELRLIAPGPSFESLVTLAVDEVRASAEGNATLLSKLVGALELVASQTRDEARRRVLRRLLSEVGEAGRRTLAAPPDRGRFLLRLAEAARAME